MKKSLLFLIILLPFAAITQTIQIDGNAYLELADQHDGIAVNFERTAPSSLYYTFYTDVAGYYSCDIEEGIYDITYVKDGYIPITTEGNSFYSDTQLSDITLELQGLSGDLTGTLVSGTYKVSGDITVPEGQTLIIEPNTFLKFKENLVFTINGVINANGTENDSIIFSNYTSGINWDGLEFINATLESSFSFCKISHSNSSAIFMDNSKLAVK